VATFQLGDDSRHTDLAAAQLEINQLRAALRTRPTID
jgi:hypothetical protein